MNTTVRLIGITMVGVGAGALQWGICTGLCIGVVLLGAGLVVDSLRK